MNSKKRSDAKRRPPQQAPKKGESSRRLAIDALQRIDSSGAYANLLLPKMLDASDLSEADRRFVTELVYGTTRMQRACDYLYERYLLAPVEADVRAALRVGTYQLCYLRTPAHAAVSATVGALGGKARSLVNAVLRKVADGPVTFPDEATRLSYPDWIVSYLTDFLGHDDALKSLEAMNQPAPVTVRSDGYVQDEASQAVVAAMQATAGELIVDLCAAPGGKATAIAGFGANVVAADRRASRVRLIAENTSTLDLPIPLMIADGRFPALRPGTVDQVLVDAPCSGLGSLRRRADARWRIEPEAPGRLQDLQIELVVKAADLLRPGGILTYSVCTLGPDEGRDVISAVLGQRSDLEVSAIQGEPSVGRWVADGDVSYLLPVTTDGMMIARLVRSGH